MNRRKKLYLNTITAMVQQVIVVVCGFILPRYILSAYGSDVNGLVNSVTHFLSIISFLELGVGPVIQSNLYKPLAEKDNETVSKIIVSSEKFYRRIALFFLVYILCLIVIYPFFNTEFDAIYSGSLIVIISISTFAQYYFGITYQVFLNADQKVYIQSILSIITVVLNTIISVMLIKAGFSIHIVKLASTFIYVIRPIGQNLYVNKNYHIDKKITYTTDPIKQKWNGFSQHLAATVCSEIDVVLLTAFTSYQNVSIYSVYQLVVTGISNVIMTTVSGLESFWGNMIARGEKKLLLDTFCAVECLIHMIVTLLFVSTAILIAPFVNVYVGGIEDRALYYLPMFGAALSFAYASQCLRIPYFRMIKAAGHYKQTQNGAFISMILNIVLSLILVFRFQLIGVAIGTIVAMLYHTIYFAWYLKNNIINRDFKEFIRHLCVDVISGLLAFLATLKFEMKGVGYFQWSVYAIKVTLIVSFIVIFVNIVLYRKEFVFLFRKLVRKE